MPPAETPPPPQHASAAVGDSMEGTLDLLESIANRDADAHDRLVPTGFRHLDELLGGGLWPGHLTVIAGRPGAGTSTLGLNFAARASIDHQMRSLVMCADTSTEELNFRLLASQAKIPTNHLRNGSMSNDEWERLNDVIGTVSSAPLHLNTDPVMTVQKVSEEVERLAERGLRLLVLDGLQSLDQVTPRDSRYFEVCDDVHTLKQLARLHNIPIVVISKLNRVSQQRVDRTPMLHDLRNAGDIEDVADQVVLLHRDDMYEVEPARPGEADFLVEKNRHGPTRWLTVAFQGHFSRFVDIR